MSRIARAIAFTLLLVLTSLPSWAGFIRGVVRDTNQRPVERLVVRLRCDRIVYQDETRTDPSGKFDFDGLLPNVYILTIEGQGLRPYQSQIDISMSKQAYEDITVRPDMEHSPEVPVPPRGTVNARAAQISPAARKEFDLGEARMQAQDVPGSIEHFQKAISLYANYAEAYQLLGVAHMEIGKAVEAEPELRKAVELEPRLATAYFALGICRNQLAKYTEAEVALARGLELEPNSADGHYHIAEAYWNLGRFDDSEPHARKTLALNPDMAPAHVLLGNSLLRKRDAVGALKEFKEYLRLAPQGEFAPATQVAVVRLEKALQQAAPK